MVAEMASHESQCKLYLEELKRNGNEKDGLITDGTKMEYDLPKDNGNANDDDIYTETRDENMTYLLEKRHVLGNERLLEELFVESCCEGKKRVVEYLLNHGLKPDCKNRYGRTALISACGKGREEIVDLLLRHGADVECYIDWGHTPLMTAALRGNEKIVASLLDHGADINGQHIALNTALMCACKTLQEDIVALLLRQGAKVNAVNYDKTTALMQSFHHIQDESQGILKKIYDFSPKIIKKNNDVYSEKGKDETTVVVCDCNSCRHERIVELLINHGADVNAEDHFNRTSLIHAITHKNHRIVRMLFENGANFESIYSIKEWKRACKQKLITFEIFKLLLEYVPDLDARNMYRETILMTLCERGDFVRGVELLLEKGVDVEARDRKGKTALMHACKNGEEGCVDALLKYGADVNAQDGDGVSALMWAAMENCSNCVQKLLDAGAKLRLLDKSGRTVFSHALASCKGGECLRLLLVDGLCMQNGRLKPVHRNALNIVTCELALIVVMEVGVFQWDWFKYSDDFSINVGLLAMKAGICPGKVTYHNVFVSPLVQSFLQGDRQTAKTFLQHFYYFPQDYRTLCTDLVIRKEIKDWELLEEFTLQPLSLQTWSYLIISKAISIPRQPGQRTRRVDSLPIPDKLKRRLKFVTIPQ